MTPWLDSAKWMRRGKEHCEVNRSAIGEHFEVVRDLSSWALDKFKDSLGVLARMQYLLSKKQLVGKVDEVAPLRSRAAANVLSRMTALRKHFVDKLSTMSAGDDRETFVIFLGFLSSAEVHHNVMQMVNESTSAQKQLSIPPEVLVNLTEEQQFIHRLAIVQKPLENNWP